MKGPRGGRADKAFCPPREDEWKLNTLWPHLRGRDRAPEASATEEGPRACSWGGQTLHRHVDVVSRGVDLWLYVQDPRDVPRNLAPGPRTTSIATLVWTHLEGHPKTNEEQASLCQAGQVLYGSLWLQQSWFVELS
jgi:hypothetical protein